MREQIQDALKETLEKMGIVEARVLLEHPAELQNGDYATSVALQYAKQLGKSPRALAEEIVAALGMVDGVSKIEVAGPGFINFHLASNSIAESIGYAGTEERWGAGNALTNKKIMVEYTDPNPFKEFHIGHLMSNAIGESISRLFEYSGAAIKRANYQGDVGPHVAKAIWGIRRLNVDPSDAAALGRAYAEGSNAYEKDPVAKNEIEVINAQVYDRSDAAVNEIYAVGRAASLKHFEEIYTVLGTKFDYSFFESQTASKGAEMVKGHSEIFETSDGAIVYKGEQDGLHTRVFITSKGLPTYETKDLGLAVLKSETWNFDESYTVTASEQTDYFAVMTAALKRINPTLAEKIKHISHGMMRLPTGKMSSRTGDVITGESLLNELIEVAKERAKESRAEDHEKLAEQVAVAAIKYQILKQGSGKDIVFDRERALSLEGDSGPYLQYAHARTCAIEEKASEQGVASTVDTNAEPTDLTRLLHRFPEVVERAASELEPHLVTNYLLEIAAAFNSWYAQVHILDGTPEAAHKVAVVAAVRRTLRNGLWVLGIPTPEKM